ncbi:tRNA synthetase RNA-binding protein [Porphyromonas gulae]|uniref:S4 domain-containing protein n=1 Tax=Porphyromonas gulae TaxID=111105 RepID=UPI00052CE6F8|nr:S4 domain-containing protein [Porphyromonas gulae]KGN72630.1 tRNA synthetase RNA-binding protein [Porphyromonas gulae]KGO03689.1 tRNA synthetase RNA-binding protein [Porphyromonas gulae]
MKLRINKLISDAGLGSRREAEKYITEGRVKINGRIARLTDLVCEKDIVLLDDIDIPIKDLIREEISLRKYEERLVPSASNQGGRQDEKRKNPRPKQHKEAPSQRNAGKPRSESRTHNRWDDDDDDDFGFDTGRGFRKGNRKNDSSVKKFRH